MEVGGTTAPRRLFVLTSEIPAKPAMATEQPTSAQSEAPAKEVLSAAVRRRLQRCFEHGSRLASQKEYDHDYANTMFTECVSKDPGNLAYVEAFLNNLQRKYKNNKRGARIKGFGGKGAFKKITDAMESLHRRKGLFGFSLTVTRENADFITSDEFIDEWVNRGCFLGWVFIYIPIGRKPDIDLMPTPEQRRRVGQRVRYFRATRPIFMPWPSLPRRLNAGIRQS